MPFLKTEECSIHYELIEAETSAPCVTLVNGHTRTLKDFGALKKRLQLESPMSILTLDNRGSGETQETGSFTLRDMAADILALWDHLGIKKSHVLGISMGGLIAQSLLLDHHAGQRVDSLALVSSFADNRSATQEAIWSSETAANQKTLEQYVAPLFAEKNQALLQMMAKMIAKQQAEGGVYQKRATLQRQAIRSQNTWPAKACDYEGPTLILHGKEDRIIPPTAVFDLQERFPDAKIELLEGKGHLLLAEAPIELSTIYRAFLTAAMRASNEG